jgi:hypothetical protein
LADIHFRSIETSRLDARVGDRRGLQYRPDAGHNRFLYPRAAINLVGYARWAVTGVFLGVFVYELWDSGFHWQELYFLPILGAAQSRWQGLIPDPGRWPSFHVDVAESRGMKLCGAHGWCT